MSRTERRPRARLGSLVGIFAIATAAVGVAPANATHSWGTYHWAKSADSVTVSLGDNLNSTWEPHLRIAADGVLADDGTTLVHKGWTFSEELDTPVVPGQTNPKNCRPTSGRVEVCNASYGKTGWLGIAQIWISGGHIVQGTAKQNDTYFNKPPYNTVAWRQFVLCQEVGHTFGLGHADEDFGNANLGTCMDYTSDPDGTKHDQDQLSNEYPDAHDFEQLTTIYTSHVDGTIAATTSSSSSGFMNGEAVSNDSSTWGKMLRGADRDTTSLFVREHSGGDKIFTFVIWAR